MPAYTVTLPDDSNPQLFENKRGVVLFAEDVAAARIAAASAYNDMSARGVSAQWEALFAAATVTEIVAATDLEGAVLRARVKDIATPFTYLVDVSVTGAAADTMDLIGAAMVTALNLDPLIAGAAYSGGNLLTISDIADALGDHTLEITFILNGVNLDNFVGAIVDEGIAGAVLTVQMATDAIVVPNVFEIF